MPCSPAAKVQCGASHQGSTTTDTPTAAPSLSDSNLYVGGLGPSVTSGDLERRFAVFGKVISAKVMLNIHSGESRGMGFVKFADPESASAAVRGLHRSLFAGQRLLVRPAESRADFRPPRPTTRVYLRNVPFEVTAEQLEARLRPYGEVTGCTLHLDTAGFKSGGQGVRSLIAFVTMGSISAAEAVVEGMHMQRVFGGEATVLAKLAEPQAVRRQDGPAGPKKSGSTEWTRPARAPVAFQRAAPQPANGRSPFEQRAGNDDDHNDDDAAVLQTQEAGHSVPSGTSVTTTTSSGSTSDRYADEYAADVQQVSPFAASSIAPPAGTTASTTMMTDGRPSAAAPSAAESSQPTTTTDFYVPPAIPPEWPTTTPGLHHSPYGGPSVGWPQQQQQQVHPAAFAFATAYHHAAAGYYRATPPQPCSVTTAPPPAWQPPGWSVFAGGGSMPLPGFAGTGYSQPPPLLPSPPPRMPFW